MIESRSGQERSREDATTRWRRFAMGVAAVAMLTLTGCESASPGQRGAGAGAALGSGIALVTGAGAAGVIGGGLIGGAVGYMGGSAVGR